MKNKELRIAGKRVFVNDDELGEGYVEIIIEVNDLLDEIDNEDISDYAGWTLDMKHEDDFDEEELVSALEDLNFNFSRQIDELDCIEFLEDNGYIITTPKDVDNSLDIIDASMLDEITEIFLNASVFESENIYNLIKNA